MDTTLVFSKLNEYSCNCLQDFQLGHIFKQQNLRQFGYLYRPKIYNLTIINSQKVIGNIANNTDLKKEDLFFSYLNVIFNLHVQDWCKPYGTINNSYNGGKKNVTLKKKHEDNPQMFMRFLEREL